VKHTLATRSHTHTLITQYVSPMEDNFSPRETMSSEHPIP
jgi:hypothetical protein